MKILVLGGTGAMGEHLVEIVAASGMETHVTSRTRSGVAGCVHYIQGNAKDDAFLAPILARKWDAIVDFMVYSTPAFERRLPRLLESTSQYFYLSSARVYANSPGPITEESPRLLDVVKDPEFLATDEYALAKARQENLLRASGRRNWTIIRPYITYARERLQLGVLEKEGWLYRALRRRSIVFSRDINERVTTMTSGRDVARAMVSLIGKTDALSEAFHVTTSQSHGWNHILKIYLEAIETHLGFKPRVHLADLAGFLRCHPSKYQVIYDRVFDRVFDNSKIGRYLDVGSFTPVDNGLREALCAFLSNPTFKQVDWRAEAKKDRLVREHSSLWEPHGLKDKARYAIRRYFWN
jgi:Nucleoside-diphosphate-sugar epimerases